MEITMRPWRTAGAVFAAAVICGCAAAQDGAPQEPRPGDAAPDVRQPVDIAKPQSFQTAEELLAAIESADEGISTFTAYVQYLRNFGPIEGNADQTRRGLVEVGTRTDEFRARRVFEITFNTLIMDGAKRDETQVFVFDGEWFAEKLPAEKRMTRRRVVRPGESADPLRIGQGPFPLPLGQKKDEILRRFDVELLAGLQGQPAEMPVVYRRMYQLRLVPKHGTPEAADFDEIRIWYDPGAQVSESDGVSESVMYKGTRLMPRRAQTIAPDGSRTEVVLSAYRVNFPARPDAFQTGPVEGWDVQTEEWRQPAGD